MLMREPCLATCLRCRGTAAFGLRLESQVQSHLDEARTADSALDQANTLARRWRILVARYRAETVVQTDIIVRRVEARVIEDVEELGIIPQAETLCKFEILEHIKIKSRLERASKNVSSRISVSRFEVVAHVLTIGGAGERIHRRTAGGYSALAGSQERNRKGCGIEVWVSGIHTGGALQLDLLDGFP